MPARAGRLDAGRGVLDDEAVCGFDPQLRRGEQENLRVRLALPQIATADVDIEDVEQTLAEVEADRRIIALAFFEDDATAIGQPSASTA